MRFSVQYRLIRGISLAAFTTLLLLGSIEIAARALHRSVRAVPKSALPPLLTGLPELTTLAQLRTPNQRGAYLGQLYETNSRGLRSAEIPLRKPAGVSRIALIGDSVAMGAGVRAEDTYGSILARELTTVRPGNVRRHQHCTVRGERRRSGATIHGAWPPIRPRSRDIWVYLERY